MHKKRHYNIGGGIGGLSTARSQIDEVRDLSAIFRNKAKDVRGRMSSGLGSGMASGGAIPGYQEGGPLNPFALKNLRRDKMIDLHQPPPRATGFRDVMPRNWKRGIRSLLGRAVPGAGALAALGMIFSPEELGEGTTEALHKDSRPNRGYSDKTEQAIEDFKEIFNEGGLDALLEAMSPQSELPPMATGGLIPGYQEGSLLQGLEDFDIEGRKIPHEEVKIGTETNDYWTIPTRWGTTIEIPKPFDLKEMLKGIPSALLNQLTLGQAGKIAERVKLERQDEFREKQRLGVPPFEFIPQAYGGGLIPGYQFGGQWGGGMQPGGGGGGQPTPPGGFGSQAPGGGGGWGGGMNQPMGGPPGGSLSRPFGREDVQPPAPPGGTGGGGWGQAPPMAPPGGQAQNGMQGVLGAQQPASPGAQIAGPPGAQYYNPTQFGPGYQADPLPQDYGAPAQYAGFGAPGEMRVRQEFVAPELAAPTAALTQSIMDVGTTPYEQYQGPRLAGFSPDEAAAQAAFGAYGRGQGPMGTRQAAGTLGEVGRGLGSMAGRAEAGALDPYMSQYMAGVVDPQLRKLQEFSRQQGEELKSRAAGATGGIGGLREGVLRRGQLQDVRQQAADVIGQGQQRAFESAQQAFGQAHAERLRQLGALSGVAGQQRGLGQQQQQQQLARLQQMQQAGATQRQLQQAGLDVGWEEFQRRQQYPQKQTSWMAQQLAALPYQNIIQSGLYTPQAGPIAAGLGSFATAGSAVQQHRKEEARRKSEEAYTKWVEQQRAAGTQLPRRPGPIPAPADPTQKYEPGEVLSEEWGYGDMG